MEDKKICYDINDLYEMLPLGKNQVYALVKSKGFPAIQIGKKFLIPKKHFEAWLAKQVAQ